MTLSLEILIQYENTGCLWRANLQEALENFHEKCYAASRFFIRHFSFNISLELMRALTLALLLATLPFQTFAETITLKEISYRGGLITFSIPRHWVEEYAPEGGGTFYENAPDTGTLRLNVITVRPPLGEANDAAKDALSVIINPRPKDIRRLPNGNAFATRKQHTTERGQPITLYWWHLARPTAAGEVRIANFSFTVLRSKENSRRTAEETKLLTSAIQKAYFHAASSR